MKALTGVVAAASLAVVVAATLHAETVWCEGESPVSHTMNRHPWWYDQVKRDQLSGGDWISNFSPEKEGTASYEIEIPRAAKYFFWLRANPVKSQLSYRLGGGEWREVDFASARDVRNIAADGKPDLRFIGWVKAGAFDLPAGKLALEFRMHNDVPDLQNHGGIDAFMFTSEVVLPEGTGREGGATTPVTTVGEEGTWPFTPADDPFSNDALLDLRYLNEKQAGETGFIHLSADGVSFVKGNGEPIRFWSVVSGGYRLEPQQMETHCRYLAKLGVNMARLHTQLCNSEEGARLTDVNEKELDGIFRFVATAKKHGIYVTLSPYWANVGKVPASWGLANYDQGPWGLLFFNDQMQAGYKAWVRELYTRTNPYTGLPLKDDPAVAIAQVQNEDSLLFYTMQDIKEPYAGELRGKFGDWLKARYGSLAQAQAAWGNAQHEQDNFEQGEVGLYIIWRLTSEAPRSSPDEAKRMADELEFLGWMQHRFYADMGDYMRKELGLKQLINATNWRSADPVLLDDVERWTYTANDVIAVNRYTGVIHSGEMVGWRVDPGQYFLSQSVLTHPETFPAALKQVVGYPMIITESAWVHPTDYQTEGPFLAAAYCSLTGVDSLYWFAYGDPSWTLNPVWPWWQAAGGQNSIKKWEGSVPQQAGMFPAAALAFRLGYIQPADKAVVYEERSLGDLWTRKVPIISEEGKFDPNRDVGDFAPKSLVKQEVERLAFMVGPVQVKYGGDSVNNAVADLSKYIDRNQGKVRSVTGQIELDYRTGLCTVDAPQFQGVAGFLKRAGGRFALSAATINCDNDYATIIVTALDGKPLRESGRILIQVGTEAHLNGWTVRDAEFDSGGQKLQGKQIVATGAPPWRLTDTKATLTIKNPTISKATLLDVNGYRAADVSVQRQGDALIVELPGNTMYLVVD